MTSSLPAAGRDDHAVAAYRTNYSFIINHVGCVNSSAIAT
jgi:hypothetical protein